MTLTLTLQGTDEAIKAEVQDGELFLSISAPHGPAQRVSSMEAAIGRIFPDYPLIRRTGIAANLLASVCDTLKAQALASR